MEKEFCEEFKEHIEVMIKEATGVKDPYTKSKLQTVLKLFKEFEDESAKALKGLFDKLECCECKESKKRDAFYSIGVNTCITCEIIANERD